VNRLKLWWYQRQLAKIDAQLKREDEYLTWIQIDCDETNQVIAELKTEWRIVAEKINKLHGF